MSYKLPFDILLNAYYDCRKKKRRSTNAVKFEMDLSMNLFKLWRDLNGGRYKIGPSNTFIVDKPVKREIFAAQFRDRIVHHLVINRIMPYFEKYGFINDSYSCRKGKGTHYAINRVYDMIKECSNNYTKDCYILKCDLKGFFMSIDKRILYKLLFDFLSKFVNWESEDEFIFYDDLIKKIVFNVPTSNCNFNCDRIKWKGLPKDKSLFYCDDFHGIPIGNLTSQIFANFYLGEFDRIMEKKFGGYYGRYVDDFVVVCQDKDKITSCIDNMRKYLFDKFNATLHPKKMYIQHYSKGVKFVGGVIKPNRKYIGNRTVGNLYSMMRINIENHPKDKKFNEYENNYILKSMNSYLGYMRHFNSYNIRKKVANGETFKRMNSYLKFNKSLTKVEKTKI